MLMVAEIAKSLPDLTAASLLAALPQQTKVGGGVFPVLDFTKPVTAGPGLTHQASGGQWTPVTGDFVDVFHPPKAS